MNHRSISDGSDRTEMNGMAEPELQVASRILKELSSFWWSQYYFDGSSSHSSSSDASSSDLYDLFGKDLKKYAFLNVF
jgi:hypothetical protein